MSKLVTASVTFGSGEVLATNGTFGAFAVGDTIEVLSGSSLNSGFHTVTGVDATNQSFLTLDPAPKSEGPITVTIRTP